MLLLRGSWLARPLLAAAVLRRAARRGCCAAAQHAALPQHALAATPPARPLAQLHAAPHRRLCSAATLATPHAASADTFTSVGLSEPVAAALQALGFATPTTVQARRSVRQPPRLPR